MKMQLTRISVLQSSKIIIVLNAIMGFIYTLIGVPMILFGNRQFRMMGIVYALMPLIMALVTFIFFTLIASLYNLLAKRLGGIEFEIKNVD